MKIHEGFMKIYKVELNLQLEKVLGSALSINQHHGVWQGIWSWFSHGLLNTIGNTTQKNEVFH